MLKRGFTLVELVFVLGLIAIMLAITLPAFKGMNDETSLAKVNVELAVLKTALETYYAQNGSYPSAADGYQDVLISQTKLINMYYRDPFTKELYRYVRPEEKTYLLFSPGMNRQYEIDPIASISGNKLKVPAGADDIFMTNLLIEDN
jgi:prepilin-type N-terminal cleavage/methylation domain-containing protein